MAKIKKPRQHSDNRGPSPSSLDRPLPNPRPTHWYLEPIGEYTNRALAQRFPGKEGEMIRTEDGVKPMWSMTLDSVRYFEESRKTDLLLQFSAWYKDKKTEKVELWFANASYMIRNRAITHARWGTRPAVPKINGVTTADKLPMPGRPPARKEVV